MSNEKLVPFSEEDTGALTDAMCLLLLLLKSPDGERVLKGMDKDIYNETIVSIARTTRIADIAENTFDVPRERKLSTFLGAVNEVQVAIDKAMRAFIGGGDRAGLEEILGKALKDLKEISPARREKR